MTTSATKRITVRHGDESYGPYSIEDVNSLLLSGRLSGDDLAWVEGTPEWTQLSSVPGALAVPPLPDGDRRSESAADGSERMILPAFLLAFFLGPFGVHRFYVGKTGSGIAMLVLTLTLVGVIVTAIWATIDWIMIVCGAFRDAEDKLLTRWT